VLTERVAHRVPAPLPCAPSSAGLTLSLSLAALYPAPPLFQRDLKPEHILLAPDGPRIADFSTAAWLPNAPAAPQSLPLEIRKRSAELRRSIEAYHARRTASLKEQQQHAPGAVAEFELPSHAAAAASAAAAAPPAKPAPADAGRPQHSDVLNHRTGSIEYMAPEMLSKPTAAEVFHLVRGRPGAGAGGGRRGTGASRGVQPHGGADLQGCERPQHH
jgi:serine/threonine protein kinase